MTHDPSEKTNISRRRFIQAMTSASLASAAVALPGLQACSKGQPQRTVSLPKFKVTEAAPAFDRYECLPGLKRVNGKNVAFKVVAEEFGINASDQAQTASLMRHVSQGRLGTGMPVKNPLDARMYIALVFAATTWDFVIGPTGDGLENKGFLSWTPQNLPPDLTGQPVPIQDPADATKKIKIMAAYAGADKTGIAELNRHWVFEATCRNYKEPGPAITKPIVFKDVEQPLETQKELIIPDSVRYAVVHISVMPRALNQLGPATLASATSSGQGYAQMGLTSVALANAIRSLGYVAIPCSNDTALSVPLAIDAGLGELGRLGYLITPEWGPHVRIAKVLTNLPLVPDRPIQFGVTDFCTSCGICAAECPAGAISPDKERSFKPTAATEPCANPGARKWYVNGKRCFRWWLDSGMACSRCMDVCPYTQLTMGDGFNGKPPSPEEFWNLEHNALGRRKIVY